jgi:hypothetical protein
MPPDTGPPVATGPDAVTPEVARRTFRTLEPCHALVYFCPEAVEAYAALGLDGRQGYFASRSAAMGAVAPEVVVATFFNFHPVLVRRAMAGVWDVAPPARVLAARHGAADAALRRSLGGAVGSEELRRAADLARRCADAAAARPEGRPLFAGHASLPWPEEPHLVLWHAQTRLREFRGDAHVAALLLHGCSGLEALVMHAATGEVGADVLRATRAWSTDEWTAGAAELCRRGWLTLAPSTGGDGWSLTEEGARQRALVEDLTDRLSVPAYAAIGAEACAELRRLVRPLSAAIVASWTAPGTGAR